MQDTGCLGLVHWDDPEGWYDPGEREVGGGFIGRTDAEAETPVLWLPDAKN